MFDMVIDRCIFNQNMTLTGLSSYSQIKYKTTAIFYKCCRAVRVFYIEFQIKRKIQTNTTVLRMA